MRYIIILSSFLLCASLLFAEELENAVTTGNEVSIDDSGVTKVERKGTGGSERTGTVREVFFQGTNYELDVYKIYGRQDGPTMLIIGGIQGDEPGGFLSADSYSEVSLAKGNLIVIPRTNFYSILLFNREANGVDMNRLFHKSHNTWQGRIVDKIKEYMKESDIFLNLHDGWGYHYPKYINWYRSPDRFGYSVIVDEDEYTCGNGKVLKLGDMARTALEAANAKIPSDDPKKHYFNTETDKKSSKYKTMKKSATWYAVTELCIPAFGIEGSKNMAIDKNVLYHNYVINEFIKLSGIEIEEPGLDFSEPKLHGSVIKVENGGPHYEKEVTIYDNMEKFIRDGGTLLVNKGDNITVTEIISNHKRGLSCDIAGFGNLNDINKKYQVLKDTKITFRKDNIVIGNVFLSIKKPNMAQVKNSHTEKSQEAKPADNSTANKNIEAKNGVIKLKDSEYYFLVLLNGKEVAIRNGGAITVKKGDTISIKKLFSRSKDDYNLRINFKGWEPRTNDNIGDDRDYEITFPAKLIRKYAVSSNKYPILAMNSNDKEVARAYIIVEQ